MKRAIVMVLIVFFLASSASAKVKYPKAAHKDMAYHGAKKVLVQAGTDVQKAGCAAYRFVRFVF